MNEYLNWLANLISQLGNWGYFLIALLSFFEAIPLLGFFIPGVVILIFGGWLVAENIFNPFDLIVITACFTFLGDIVAFVIGRRWSNSFKKQHKILKESYLVSAKRFIDKRGSSGIFWGRFISPVRSMLYVLLGLVKTPWLKFVWPVAISSLLFTSLYISIGYLAGSAWQTFESWSGRLAVAIIGVAIIIIFFWWLKDFFTKQGRQLKNIISSALRIFFSWYQKTNWWNNFSNKFTRLSKIIIKLTNPKEFFGLPLVSLIITNIIVTYLVIYCGFLVLGQDNYLLDLDFKIEAFIKLFAQPHLATLMFFVTMLMSPYFMLSIAILVSLWLVWEKRRSYIIGLWILVGGIFLTTSFIKIMTARPRPMSIFLVENSYSFPSWHAAVAFGFLFYLAYIAIRHYPRWSRSVSLFFISSLLIIAIGFSRLYLGVHYFSDVLVGYLVGLWWFIVAVIYQRTFSRIDNPQKISKKFRVIVLLIIMILALVIYGYQVFKNRGVSASFFSNLKKVVNQDKILFNTNKFEDDWLVTESLRGTARRPINFIFNDNSNSLEEILIKTGWTKHLEPTLGNVVNRGKFFIFKKDYINSPLQPRFWNNEPNSLSFTKKSASDQNSDFYILRLWQLGDPGYKYPHRFMAEITTNKNFSWSRVFKKGLLDPAIKLLLRDITESSRFTSLETKNFNFISDSDEAKGINSIVYIINLK